MPKISIGDHGTVSYTVHEPDTKNYIIMLAHGAGAGMDHPFIRDLADQLAAQDMIVVRFNFPYKEQGKKLPGSPKPAIATVKALSEWCKNHYPALPLLLAGKSYGGRMSAGYLANDATAQVAGIVYFGFPLHAPGKPDKKRAENLYKIDIPQLFLQGTNDALANFELITEVVKQCKIATLHAYPHADHSFKVPKKLQKQVDPPIIQDLALQVKQWAKNQI